MKIVSTLFILLVFSTALVGESFAQQSPTLSESFDLESNSSVKRKGDIVARKYSGSGTKFANLFFGGTNSSGSIIVVHIKAKEPLNGLQINLGNDKNKAEVYISLSIEGKMYNPIDGTIAIRTNRNQEVEMDYKMVLAPVFRTNGEYIKDQDPSKRIVIEGQLKSTFNINCKVDSKFTHQSSHQSGIIPDWCDDFVYE